MGGVVMITCRTTSEFPAPEWVSGELQLDDPQRVGQDGSANYQEYHGDNGIDPNLLIQGGDEAYPSDSGLFSDSYPFSAEHPVSLYHFATSPQTTAGFSRHQNYPHDQPTTSDAHFHQTGTFDGAGAYHCYPQGHQAAPVHAEDA